MSEKPKRILVVGGGPAGLYFSVLTKLQNPTTQITVCERNQRDETFGFGVVFSDDSYAVRCVGTKGSEFTFIVNPYQRSVKGSDQISVDALKSVSRWSTQRGHYP